MSISSSLANQSMGFRYIHSNQGWMVYLKVASPKERESVMSKMGQYGPNKNK